MKKLLLILCLYVNYIFALDDVEFSKFITKNSLNFELLKSPPSKIYASNPTLLYLLYALDSSRIIGSNFEWNQHEKPYLKKDVLELPVVGGFFGQGKIPNIEMLLSLDPELILLSASSKNIKNMVNIFGSIKKPMLYLKSTTLEDYIISLEILGRVIKKEKRANKLIDHARESLAFSQKLQESIERTGIKKPSVYYAQESDGLSTECEGSPHSAIISLSGGIEAHKCKDIASGYGRVKVSFEQVLAYNPDVILIYDQDFYKKIYSDPKWSLLKAVKNHRAYYIPRAPFSWFDRPPSFMRFLGIKWLANILHKELAKVDIKTETREFYRLFLELELSEDEIVKILGDTI
ncbi:MAG: ABC transporter substrate-binding protein [Wolinella sp.]